MAYSEYHKSLIIIDNRMISFRRDCNGVYFIRSALDHNINMCTIEMTVTEVFDSITIVTQQYYRQLNLYHLFQCHNNQLILFNQFDHNYNHCLVLMDQMYVILLQQNCYYVIDCSGIH
jgi:hypothetical protein